MRAVPARVGAVAGPPGPECLREGAHVQRVPRPSRAGRSSRALHDTCLLRRSARIRSASFLVSRRFMTAPTAAPTMNGMRLGRLRTIRFMICWRSWRFMWLFIAEPRVDGLETSTPRSSDQEFR